MEETSSEKLNNKGGRKNIILVLILIIVVGALYAIYYKNQVVEKKHVPLTEITDKNQLDVAYTKYLNEGLKYKSEGDAGNKDSYYKAIDAYLKASEVSGGKVWMPFLNLGNVYRIVKDYDNADKSYDQAIKIAHDESIYLAKIEMYQYDLKKTETEIKSLYEAALVETSDNVSIMIKYASYLEENGDYKDSLQYWRTVSAKYPDEQRYKDEIEALEAKIEK